MADPAGKVPGLNIPTIGYVSPIKAHEPSRTRLESVPERIIVGTEGVTVDGKPFPWATVGDWVITIANDQVAYLTVNIVVTLPPDPEA